MSSFVQICSDANSELTADTRLPLDHGAASSEWSCSASLFNGGALVKRGVTKCYKMLQNVTKNTKIPFFRFPDLKLQIASELFSSEEGLLETWNNANADLDMVQKGT